MLRTLARPVRGKCRWCDHSVRAARYGWASEYQPDEPYDCPVGPSVECPPCSGTGVLEPDEDADDQTPLPCQPCRGTGRVPGPHWPWRHPDPLG